MICYGVYIEILTNKDVLFKQATLDTRNIYIYIALMVVTILIIYFPPFSRTLQSLVSVSAVY